MLGNLSAILDKAMAQAEAKKLDPAVLLKSRLAPDMLPFTFQVQTACDSAKGCAARLAGLVPPSFPDTETTFPELKARIAKTLDFVKSVKPEQIDGSEERKLSFKLGGREYHFTGQSFLLTFALPNFFFHITTAYALLRHNGIELGKQDYLGGN
jgi:hypothetical protein